MKKFVVSLTVNMVVDADDDHEAESKALESIGSNTADYINEDCIESTRELDLDELDDEDEDFILDEIMDRMCFTQKYCDSVLGSISIGDIVGGDVAGKIKHFIECCNKQYRTFKKKDLYTVIGGSFPYRWIECY